VRNAGPSARPARQPLYVLCYKNGRRIVFGKVFLNRANESATLESRQAMIAKNPIQASTWELTAALLLVVVGGYGDAASFLLVHCFSGHVTGNSVLAAIALTSGGATGELLLAVFCFLGATAFAQRLRSSTDRPLGGNGFRYVLIAEIILLFLSPYLLRGQHRALFIAAMCLAFGLQNGVLSKVEGIGLHSTYLTGTLTHLLSLLVRAGAAGPAATRFETRTLLFVWLAFVAGALCGGLMISHLGSKGVWGMLLLLTAVLAMSFFVPDAGSHDAE
jgi:uncharacterized membrane protein YoaK (UPF0700 family)